MVAEALAMEPPSTTEYDAVATRLLAKAQPELKDTLKAALLQPPPPAEKQKRLVDQIANGLSSEDQKLAWERVLAAVILLALIFWAGVYTSHDDALKDWSKALLSTFTVVLGALGAIITGESAKKS